MVRMVDRLCCRTLSRLLPVLEPVGLGPGSLRKGNFVVGATSADLGRDDFSIEQRPFQRAQEPAFRRLHHGLQDPVEAENVYVVSLNKLTWVAYPAFMTSITPTSVHERPLRTAVIGYGLAGKVFHCPFIESSPDFSLNFIATNDPGRRSQARAEHSDAEIVADANELAGKADQLDLVVLASPPGVHLEQGLSFLGRGVALVVDKPFAASVAEAEKLIQRAQEVGKALIVFQNRRWDGDFLTVKKLLDSGKLGDVYQFESSFEHWAPNANSRWQDLTPASLGGGVTFDLGSHLIDQALTLFGPIAELRSDLRTIREGGGNDDASFVELHHQSGVRSRLWMSRIGALPGPRFRVLGTKAAYVSYGLDGQELALASGMLPTDDRYGIAPEETWGMLGVSAAGHPAPSRIPTERGNYPAFYAGVAAALRGSGAVPVSPEDALEVLKILENIRSNAY
jgi:predicted dehydrogenase